MNITKMSIVAGTVATACLVNAAAAETVELKSTKDKASYSIGASVGNNLKRQAIDVNIAALVKGMEDALGGKRLQLTQDEIQEAMEALQKDMASKQEQNKKVAGEKNKKEGDAFLAENKKKEGVKTLASGLQYKVIKAGTGAMPKATDTVTTHYKGTLLDGTEFDSSYKRNEPTSFPVNGVIKGWQEALQLMKVGSKWQLFIPSDLAYGENGTMGGPIGPNATLVFEIELIDIKAGN
jgi:FKBP-type peptidyl-prolyl cis-trans isomerase FklB